MGRAERIPRLRAMLAAEERPLTLYRQERRDRDFPGLFIDPECRAELRVVEAPSPEAVAAREAVVEHVASSFYDADPPDVDIDRVDGPTAGLGGSFIVGWEAVRVNGWLGRHALLGLIAPPQHSASWTIDDDYPPQAIVNTHDRLRPTAYGSAYGVSHPGLRRHCGQPPSSRPTRSARWVPPTRSSLAI